MLNMYFVNCIYPLWVATHTFLICKGSIIPLHSISLVLSDCLLLLFSIITKSHKEGENEQKTLDNILDVTP